MESYYRVELERKVTSPNDPKGRDFAVCRADTEADALGQLPRAMRECVSKVTRYFAMRECYPNPYGILREDAI